MSGWKFLLLVGSLLPVGLLGGCGSPPPPKADDTAASSAETRVQEVVPPASSAAGASNASPAAPAAPPATPPKSTLKLLSPGGEPRRALRYAFKEAKEEDAEMDLRMKMDISIGGRALATPALPTMRSVLHTTPKKLGDDGSISYAFEIRSFDLLKDVKAPPALESSMKAELQKLVGLKGTSTVSDRGVSSNIELEVPQDTTPQVAQLMESVRQQISELTVELPEDPVGKGAKWEKVGPLTLGGIALEQRSTFTLVDAKEGSIKLDATVVQVAKPQEVKQPGLPEGAKVTLQSLDTKGSSKGDYRLGALVGKLSGKASSKIVMQLEANGQKQPMETKTELTSSVLPKTSAKGK